MTLLKIFYSSLYIEENSSDFNINEYLSHINLPTLNTEEAKLCNLEISENECWLTLNKMSKNKAPGPKGFSAEFFMTFWGELKSLFLSCIAYSILMGEISPTQSQGIFTLIPKKEKSFIAFKLPTNYFVELRLQINFETSQQLNETLFKNFDSQ